MNARYDRPPAALDPLTRCVWHLQAHRTRLLIGGLSPLGARCEAALAAYWERRARAWLAWERRQAQEGASE